MAEDYKKERLNFSQSPHKEKKLKSHLILSMLSAGIPWSTQPLEAL